MDVDHYAVLGLPSGLEGLMISAKDITKAYRLKALELHPDKRPDDPDAPANFQKLQISYLILKDEKARKLFDDLLHVKHQKLQHQSQERSKRRRMVSDLEKREHAAMYGNPTARARSEEERIATRLREEINRIRLQHAVNKTTFPTIPLHPTSSNAFPTNREPMKSDDPIARENLVAGFQEYEDSVLEKLQKAAKRRY